MQGSVKVAVCGKRDQIFLHVGNDLAGIPDHLILPLAPNSTASEYGPLVAFGADVNVFLDPLTVPELVLKQLTGAAIAWSDYGFPKLLNDDLYLSPSSLDQFKAALALFERPFDFILHHDRLSQRFLERQGVKVSGFRRFPVAAQVRSRRARESALYDIALVGQSTPHRERLLDMLAARYTIAHLARWVTGEDVLRLFRAARIVLICPAEEGDVGYDSLLPVALASQAAVVVERPGPIDEDLPRSPLLAFSNPAELQDACEAILNSAPGSPEAALETTAGPAFSTARAFADLISDFQSGALQTPALDKAQVSIGPLEIALRYKGMRHLIDEWIHVRG